MRSQSNRIIRQATRSTKLRRLPRNWRIAYKSDIALRTGAKYRALHDLVSSVAETIASVHQVGAALYQHEFVDTSELLTLIETKVDAELGARVPKNCRLLTGQENGYVTLYVSRVAHMRGTSDSPTLAELEPLLASPILPLVEAATAELGESLGTLGSLPCDLPPFPAFSPSPEGIRGRLPSAAYEATVQEMGTTFGSSGSRRYHFSPKPINPAAFNRLVADLEKGV